MLYNGCRCPVVVEFEEMVISYVKVIVQAIDLV